jgi:ferrous iron transport protein B
MIVVKMQTHSYGWMMFATFFPVFLGIIVSAGLFTLGNMYGWSGVDAMTYFYFTAVGIVLVLGLFPAKFTNWKGGLSRNPK